MNVNQSSGTKRLIRMGGLVLVAFIMLGLPTVNGHGTSTPAAPLAASMAPSPVQSSGSSHPSVSYSPVGSVPLPQTLITKTAVKWNLLCANGAVTAACAPNYEPTASFRSASFWDNVNKQVIYFGGQFFTNATLNGTFAWNQSTNQWLIFNSSSDNAPSPRANMTGVWDYNDNYGMVFGGYQNTVLPTVKKFLNSTWEWFPGNTTAPPIWKNITTATHPSARGDYAMVYVPSFGGNGGYALLFGGTIQGKKLLNDTWKFTGGVWTNITGTAGNAPPKSAAMGIAYSNVDHYVVAFGGVTGSGFSNGSYKFDPATSQWTTIFANGSVALHSGPKARAAVSMDNDTASGMVFLSGGTNAGTYPALTTTTGRDGWGFLGGQWSNLTFLINHNDAVVGTVAPANAIYAPLVYMPAFGFSLLQGGKIGGGSGANNATNEVGALLNVVVALNLGEIVVSTPITVWGNATLGSMPFNYTWTVPSGCSNPGNVSTFTCSPSALGFQTFSLVVVDTVGGTASSFWRVWVDSVGTQNGAISINSTLGFTLASTFFSTDLRYPVTGFPPGETNFINATPIRTFRGPTLEGFNAVTGADFAPNCPAGSKNPGGYVLCLNFPAWKAYMAAIGGQSFITLPALENNTTLDVADALWVVNTMGYTPNFFTFGNEPEGWTCFNVPLGTNCPPLGTVPPALNRLTAYKYGIVMAREAAAVLAAVPNVPIMAIQANGNCLDTSFMGAAALYGHTLTATTSCHLYPSWPGYGVNSPTAYAYLSTRNITLLSVNIVTMRAYLSALCVGCGQPIWVTETNTAAAGGQAGKANPFFNYTQGWQSVSALTANFILAARTLIPDWSIFLTQCTTSNALAILYDDCSMKPPAFVYTNVFNNFHYKGTMLNASFGGAMRGVYALQGTDGTGSSLLISNTNTTVTAQITSIGNFPVINGVKVTTGSQAAGWQTTVYPAGLVPTSWTVPPMGVLLINTTSKSSGGNGNGGGNNGGSAISLVFMRNIVGTVTVDWTNPQGTTSNQLYGGPSCTTLRLLWSGYGQEATVSVGTQFGSYCFQVYAYANGQKIGTSNYLTVPLATLTVPPSIIVLLHNQQVILLSIAAITGVVGLVLIRMRKVTLGGVTAGIGVVFLVLGFI